MAGSGVEDKPLGSADPRMEELRRLVEGFSSLPDSQSEDALEHLLSIARELARERPSERTAVAAILHPIELPSNELQRILYGDDGPSGSNRATRPLTPTERDSLSKVWVPFFALTMAVVVAALAIGATLTYLALTQGPAWALFFTNGNAAKVACNADATCPTIGALFLIDLILAFFTPFGFLADQSRRDAKRVLGAGKVELLSGVFEKRRVVGRGENLSLVLGDQVISLNSRADRNRWVYDRVPDAGPGTVGMATIRIKGSLKGRGWILEVQGEQSPNPVRVGLKPDTPPGDEE